MCLLIEIQAILRCGWYMNIAFLSKHTLSTGTSVMRVVQPAEYLQGTYLKGSVSVGMVYRWWPKYIDVVVLHRVIADVYTVRFIKYLKAIGAVIVYDCDDLIFDFDGGEYLCRLGRRKNNQSNLFSEAMELCDVVLVSTEFLKDRATAYHNNVRVMRNALSSSFFAAASQVYESRINIRTLSTVTVAYLSGSGSHNQDFKIVEDALIKLLKGRKNVRVIIVGSVEFSNELLLFEDQFEKREFIQYDEYVSLFREIDINLVPLEVDEPFCNGKSELKYIEAGACGVPSICSSTVTYCDVIENGENGVLVGDEEWFAALCDLVDNHQKRISIGMNARRDIELNYTPEVRQKEWVEFVESLRNDFLPKPSRFHKDIVGVLVYLYYQVARGCIKRSVNRCLGLFRK